MENSRLSLELYPQKCFLRATYQVFNTNRMKPPAPMAKLRCLALKPSHYCLSLLPHPAYRAFLSIQSSSPPRSPFRRHSTSRSTFANQSAVAKISTKHERRLLFLSLSKFRIARYFRADFHPPSFLSSGGLKTRHSRDGRTKDAAAAAAACFRTQC